MSLWSKVRGTIESVFQLGLAGPQLKNNSGVIEARNVNDSAFVIVRGNSPVADNDLTTKQYVDTMTTRTVVSAQFDGNNALPANTATEHFYVVTTSGPNATIGQLLWDDGSSAGTATVLAAAARIIITTAAFTGGTISLLADSMYFWDVGSSKWLIVGGATLSGANRTIKLAITNAATQDSATTIPANATVLSCTLDIQTPYSGGATVSVGPAGSVALLQATTDNLATTAGSYEVVQDTPWGASDLAVRVTVAGAPAAGAGYCIVTYTQPNV